MNNKLRYSVMHYGLCAFFFFLLYILQSTPGLLEFWGYKPLLLAPCMVSLAMLVYCIYEWSIGNTVSGWASLGVSIWALGGLQLLMLGVVGEYVGKIYLETKHRPKYIIESTIIDGNVINAQNTSL